MSASTLPPIAITAAQPTALIPLLANVAFGLNPARNPFLAGESPAAAAPAAAGLRGRAGVRYRSMTLDGAGCEPVRWNGRRGLRMSEDAMHKYYVFKNWVLEDV